jgi:hypothetical protein
MALVLKRLSTIIAAALVLAFAAACGADGSSGSGGASGAVPGAAPRPAHHGVGCWSASAAVAGDEDVRFVVHCTGPKVGGLVRFSVSRTGFAGVGRHPAVVGPGAGASRGICRRERKQVIDCKARADGPVTVTGRAAVIPGSRCAQPVSITTTPASKCNGPTCPNQVSTIELWSDLPRGC